ncbi:hypothetical protein CVT26_012339 [Gymnopilus dilepis]|uniref:Uncharacterized protein n=1 Tax=Gymnopilus dilepis TaxID=231916 RepID=A0A409YQ15_9AGAR|nr:hypothetical protein CVT26_012339 [Gymnopilus dilepis]
MPLNPIAKSRRLPVHVKERRRQERRAQQVAVDAKRASVVAHIESLARSYAPTKEEALSKVKLSNRSHVWSIEICVGKGKDFEDIGRWYRMVISWLKKCSAELHIGLQCQKANFITGRLSDAQVFELAKLWALHDSIENRTGKTRRYRRASYGSPPAALMNAKSEEPGLKPLPSPFDVQSRTFASAELDRFRFLPLRSSLSCPPRPVAAKKASITARYNTALSSASKASSSQITLSSSDDEVPPVHVAFKDLLARRRQDKPVIRARPSNVVIEISSDSDGEVPVVKGRLKSKVNGRPVEGKNTLHTKQNIGHNICPEVIELFSDSDVE